MEPLPSIFSTIRKAVTQYPARARGCQLFLLSTRQPAQLLHYS